MDIGALSKRSWEILDLAHHARALNEEGAAPPAVAHWRLDQLEEALREADRIERAHGASKAELRVAAARREIEDTIAEVDRVAKEPRSLHDRIARHGMLFATVWVAIVSAAAVAHYAFLALFAVPAVIVALRFSQAGKDAAERRVRVDGLPFRLRLAWDKLAAAEAELARTQATTSKLS